MIIGIDMYPQMIFKTGVRVVIDNLLQNLRALYPEHEFVELRPRATPLSTKRHSYGRKIYNHLQRIIWTQVGLPLRAKRAGCDVLLCTCHFSPFIQPIPTVTLFYDMAIWRHPNWYNKLWFILNRVFAEWPSHYNKHIITISEDAKKDIVQIFGISPNKVTSAYLGVDLPVVSNENDIDVLKQYHISTENPYIFYIGPAIKHKNLTRLVQAFAILRQRLPKKSLQLVICGPHTNTHGKDNVGEIRGVIDQYKLDEYVHFTGFVPREHCSILYRNAALYAFPSLFEGFGLPMVEAMASGIPIVASNRTSLPEIGGDVAVYFDPLDVNSMVDAMYQVLTQPELREKMINGGLERAKLFTWERMASIYMDVFRRITAS